MKNVIPVNLIVAVGSVDGVCTSAAVLRNSGSDVKILFTQAFTVDKINPSEWEKERHVLLIDLAVNNRDKSMTVDFLRRLTDAGHTLVGVLDEHNADDWRKSMEAAELSFNGLKIKPISQDKGDIKSSGALLLSILGSDADEHTRELCEAADAGDRMDFSTCFGGLVNRAVKSKIADDSRRVYLAKHFATNRDADKTIDGWISEYEVILKNHEEIVATRQDLGDGIVRINAVGRPVDMTTLMKAVYDLGYDIALVENEMYNASLGKKTKQIAFGCRPGLKLDLVAIIKAAGINASGFAAKANVEPEDENTALAAVRTTIKGDSALNQLIKLFQGKKVRISHTGILFNTHEGVCGTIHETPGKKNDFDIELTDEKRFGFCPEDWTPTSVDGKIPGLIEGRRKIEQI